MQLAGEPAQPAGPHADDAEDEEVKGCAVRARRTPYRLDGVVGDVQLN